MKYVTKNKATDEMKHSLPYFHEELSREAILCKAQNEKYQNDRE